MICRLTIFAPATMLLALSTGALAQTEVPNTFQAGQPARAAEVNENFDELEAAIDQNAADILQVQGLAGLSAEAAQIQSGLNLASGLRWLVADYYMDRGAFPADNIQAGAPVPTAWSNRHVESATVVDGDIVILFRSTAASQVAGQSVTLRPVDPGSHVIWFDCLGDGVTDAFLAELDCAFSDPPYAAIYDVRQQVLTAFDLLQQSNAQQLVQDYYNTNAAWPTENALAGLGGSWTYANNYATDLTVSGDGVITIWFGGNAHTVINGQALTWAPQDNGNSIEWDCSSAGIQNKYLPAECRN